MTTTSFLLQYGDNKKVDSKGTPTVKQVLPPEKEKRSTDDLFVLLFTRLALQGIVCYTFLMYCRAGREPPLCKGRWLAQARRRDCKSKKFIVKQSLSRLRRQLPLHKGAFGLCAPKVCLLFLTSTAFVDTKAKPHTRWGKQGS